MKWKLMIQSMSPLALLTIIKNFSFVCVDEGGRDLGIGAFIGNNFILIFVMTICFLWLLSAMYFYLEFGAFKWVDRKSGYEIKSINENEEASLNFFLTIIIPLLIDDIDTLQGVLTLALIVVIIAVLLYRTKLFYANPVLTFLGYHFYEFEFKENADEEGTCIGICQGEIVHTDVIEYKKITGNVFYVKEQL